MSHLPRLFKSWSRFAFSVCVLVCVALILFNLSATSTNQLEIASTPTLTTAQFVQQGPKLVGTGGIGISQQGRAVSLSGDGNTAIVGGVGDNSGAGAAWVYIKSVGGWIQQAKLVGSGPIGIARQGWSVAISADGNTAIVGGYGDNGNIGAAWVWARSGGVWNPQGKLVASDAVGNAEQGMSVSLSGDGNTAIVGGGRDNNVAGAAWVWTRSGGVWTQQRKLVASGAIGNAQQGSSVSLSSDGNTAIVGGNRDNSNAGAAWVWTRSSGVWTQGPKLVGSGAINSPLGAYQGNSVSLSGDGNTVIVGGPQDNNNAGAAWAWTRSGGVWTQQGNKLVGSGTVGNASQGTSVSLSGDGNTAIVGGPFDASFSGQAWIWTRSGGVWTPQVPKLVGSGAVLGAEQQGLSVSLSADGQTAMLGGPGDNVSTGATWVFTTSAPTTLSIANTIFNPSTATVGLGYIANSTVMATGGQTPYSWSATGLPNGMSINSSSGALFGTPTVAGTFNVTVTVRDSGNPQQTASKMLPITVVASGTPPIPALNSPADGTSYQANTTSVNLAWGTVSGATYHLQVGTSCGGTTIANWNQTAPSSLVPGLSNGTTYFWRVRSIGTGGTSAYSTCRSFSVNSVSGSPPPVPVLSSPANGASYPAGTTSVALAWGAVAGASNYHLQVGTTCGGTSIADWNQPAVSSSVPRLSNGTTYFWRVRSIGAGGTSAFQTCRSFSVGGTSPNSVVVHPQYQGCYPLDALGRCPEPVPANVPWGNQYFGTPSCRVGNTTVRCTFNTSACVVTVASMALNFVLEKNFGTNGRDVNPAILNTYLLGPPLGYSNGGDLVPETIGTVKYPLNPSGSAIFKWEDQSGPNTVERLSAALDSGYPVYVRVNYNVQRGRYQHGVLVHRKAVIGGVTHFYIRDPGKPSDGDNDSTLVDLKIRYGTAFQIKGYLRPSNGQNFSGLQQSVTVNPDETASLAVSSGEGAQLMLIDPAGRRTGFDPGSQQQVNEIPNSSYNDTINLDPSTLDPATSAPLVRTIGVENPLPGTYQVVSYGVNSGTFELDVKTISTTGQLKRKLISGDIQAGATVNSSFDLNLNNANFDFDGDGKTDIAIFRPSNGQWWYQQSSDNVTKALTFGIGTDKIVPADYDGDGKTDAAFWRPSTGEWFVLRSSNLTFYGAPFGVSTDIPTPGDFDGDGKADLAVYRQSIGTWFVLKSSDNGVQTTPFGINGDIPVVADYDGDGKSDIAIYRPTGGSGGGEWWILRSTAGVFATPFGSATDKPVPGDYTGDGKADCAFFRPSNSNWFILRSEDLSFYAAPFGANGDIPVAGDYDGDGKYDLAVFRPSSVTWFVNKSSGGTLIQAFGAVGDKPVPSAFVP